jgi:hypothetical protein
VTRVLLGVVVVVTVMAGCGPQSFVARGVLDGQDWVVNAYPGDDGQVCFHQGVADTCTDLAEPSWKFEQSGISAQGSERWIVGGIARPEVAVVRFYDGVVSWDVATVPLSFRSDLRAFAAAFRGTFAPWVWAILDADGEPLEDPRLP